MSSEDASIIDGLKRAADILDAKLAKIPGPRFVYFEGGWWRVEDGKVEPVEFDENGKAVVVADKALEDLS